MDTSSNGKMGRRDFMKAAILGIGMISLTYAAEPMAAPGDMSAPGSQAIKGDLLKIDGEFYVVKDASGKEVRLHVDKTSKLEGTFKAGDKIEAQAIRDVLHVPAIGFETRRTVLGERQIGRAIDRNMIIIIEIDEPPKPQVARQ